MYTKRDLESFKQNSGRIFALHFRKTKPRCLVFREIVANKLIRQKCSAHVIRQLLPDDHVIQGRTKACSECIRIIENDDEVRTSPLGRVVKLCSDVNRGGSRRNGAGHLDRARSEVFWGLFLFLFDNRVKLF